MIRQSISQKQSLRFSPAQIQFINMLALPCTAFDEYLANEIEANPAIDSSFESERSEPDPDSEDGFSDNDAAEDSPDEFKLTDYIPEDQIPEYDLNPQNTSPDQEQYTPIGISENTFADYLIEQLSLCDLSAIQHTIGRYIIGNIDPDGYLRRDVLSLCDDLAFTESLYVSEKQVEDVLSTIQEFDPIGIAARSIEECLLIQLSHKAHSPQIKLAKELIKTSFSALGRKNYDKIIEQLACTKEDLSLAINEISRLNPKPGAAFSESSASHDIQVVPDFELIVEDDQIEIKYLGAPVPTLKVSREYNSMLDHYSHINKPNKSEREAISFVKTKIDAARYFIDAVRQRQNTLMSVMGSLVHHQREYILSGDIETMRPLTLKDIAEDINMDVSTVSRVVSQKYVDTPYGVLSMKDFFSQGQKNTQGEDISTREIKDHLKSLLEQEDKQTPLTDEQIADILLQKGYKLARRTVAKYREQLSIPTARLRRGL